MKFLEKLKSGISDAIQEIRCGTGTPASTEIGKKFKSLHKASPADYAALLEEYKPVASDYFKRNPPSQPSREYLVQKEIRAIESQLDMGDEEKKEREPRKQKAVYRSRPSKPKGERDRSSYEFDGEQYGKGQLALRLVRRFIEDNAECDLNTLKAAFPDDLLRSYGIVQEIEEAKRRSGKKARYFMSEQKIIVLSDGTQVVVSNQYTSDNFDPFLKRIKELGYSVMLPETEHDYM
jgi:hypothetical protein